jgi:hypothetical protein
VGVVVRLDDVTAGLGLTATATATATAIVGVSLGG